LIPSYGIIGAALASLFSYCMVNIFNSIRLYQITRIHPFTRNYVKPIIISIILLAIIYLFSSYIIIEIWMLPVILLLFFLIYGFLLILTRSFDKEDIDLLLNIERIAGLNLKSIKSLFRRFI
jgi:O-antigen/teichoic acid export membrane protein